MIRDAARSVVRGHGKEISSSRALMWGFAGASLAILVAILVPIYLDEIGATRTGMEWAPFEGPLDWVRDLVFISILPFLGSEIGAGIAARRPSPGAEISVDTVENVQT